MALDACLELLLQRRCLLGGMEDAVLGGEEFALFGPGLDGVVLARLQEVFHVFHLERDELHRTLAEAGIQEVVAQREVQELALPKGLAGELALIDLQGCFLGGVEGGGDCGYCCLGRRGFFVHCCNDKMILIR